MRSNHDYLRDMLEYIARIEHATKGGETAYKSSFLIQDATIRQYQVIGEIAKRLPDTLLATQPNVDWKAIKGFRDFLAHNYDRVDLAVMWNAIQELPELRAAVESLLQSLPPEDENENEL